MTKVSPAEEIPGLSDKNSLNISPDARSGTNLTDEKEPPEEQLVNTPKEIENSNADAFENRMLLSIETDEQPTDQGVISSQFTIFEENGMRVCLPRDVPIDNSLTIAPKLNLSADFFLTLPPTEKEIYTKDKQEIVTGLSDTTNLRKSPDTTSTTVIPKKEIQEQPFVQGSLAQFSTFAGYKILQYYTGENIKTGSRVVERSSKREHAVLGTIINVKESGKEVDVVWDDSSEKKAYCTGKDNTFDLLLFDNAQTEVRDFLAACEECDGSPFRGIRWNCLNCDHINLCSSCYMSNKHDASHIFTRFDSEVSKGVEMEARYDVQFKHFAIGIQEGAEVVLRENEKIYGNVIKIHKTLRKVARCDALVHWVKDNETRRQSVCRGGFCELMATTKTEGPSFYEEHLPFASKEYAKLGIRVVMASIANMENDRDGCIGTIIGYNLADRCPVRVQWDDSKELGHYVLEKKELKIFDNGPAGIDHDCCCMECQNPVIGMRWKCQKCQDGKDSLCTKCYMLDKHTEDQHQFSLIVEPSSMLTNQTTLNSRSKATKKKSYGIFKGAKVSHIKPGLQSSNRVDGEVLRICEGYIDYGLSIIEVNWANGQSGLFKILDLKWKGGGKCAYYPDHLPLLGKGRRTLERLDVDCSVDGISKKVTVDIWYDIKKDERRSYKPILCLIFAHQQDAKNETEDKKYKNEDEINENKDKFALMDEVLEFSKKTKLPCYIVEQKVLFHHGSSNAVFIHHSTSKDTIQELVKKGCLIFERGDTHENEEEIEYFIRMAEYVIGEKVLPVVIHLRNGRYLNPKSDATLHIPTIVFEKNSSEVIVLTMFDDCQSCYITNLETPWTVRRVLRSTDTRKNIECISAISDVQSNWDFEALICYIVIGVSMASKDKVFGKERDMYSNALSMYLLKNGKWHIPKNRINKSFHHRSIEYIFEENLIKTFEDGLWSDLREMTGFAYVPPLWNTKEQKLMITTSELHGLIFLALLRKRLYYGAKQLVETGWVRIQHIFVGCVILKKAENDWSTTHLQRKILQTLQRAFTQRAIQITSYIYAAETKEDKSKSRGQNAADNDCVENELGESVRHAGRLLLNHGYLEDAIKTQNKTFIDNITVTKVLNKMLYGEEELSFRQVWLFILLALVHLLMMPLLMINMEARPLQWFYKQYKLPVMKVFTQMFGYLALLMVYAYMLLFNLSVNISYLDCLIIGWMISFFLDETKQAIISGVRKRFRKYYSDWWNRLDWAVILVYISAMSFKFRDGQITQDASKILLVITFILLSIRILNMFSMSKFLGTKLVMIQKMFKETLAFMIILTVIMMSYNVSFYSLLYPNTELSWSEIEKVMQNGYWMLFGELKLDSDTLTEPDCTFNKTIYTSGAMSRCPTSLGLIVSPYLKALYGLIAVILLLNLLIAIYSNTFIEVHKESEFHWSQLQTHFLEEYSVKPIFPIHLQLLTLPVCFAHFIIWCTFPYLCSKTKDRCLTKNKNDSDSDTTKINNSPMFVRVFLYNTNFDLWLNSTKEAEDNGVSKSKGKIEVMEEDKITVLQKQIEVQNRKFEKHLERNNKNNDKMMEKLTNINTNMKKLMEKLGAIAEEDDQSSATSNIDFDEWMEKEHGNELD